MVDGMLAIPQGSMASGTVIAVEASGKVTGRAQLAFRFDQLHIDRDRYEIRSDTVSYKAESTKTEDAKKIGNRCRGWGHHRRAARRRKRRGHRCGHRGRRGNGHGADDRRHGGPVATRYRAGRGQPGGAARTLDPEGLSEAGLDASTTRLRFCNPKEL